MNLIKKNIILFSVLAIALALSAFFIYKVIFETNEMTKTAIRVEELKKKITELNKKTPIPNKKNYKKITADAEIIVAKTKQLNSMIGKPYLYAARAFTKAIGVPYEDFVKQWNEAYSKDKGLPRDRFFSKFLAKFDKAKVELAIDVFYDTLKIKEKSLEPFNATNIDDSIMEAFGIPRKIQPVLCKPYLRAMQDNFIAYMAKSENKGDSPLILGTGAKGDRVAKFTFDKFEGGALPRPGEVSYIFKHLKLIEDLLLRLKGSGIQSLQEIMKESLEGERILDYRIFTYNLKISAPLKNIRKFINSLLEAFKQNRIYVIKSMVLTLKEDVSALVKIEGSSDTTKSSRSRRANRFKTKQVEEVKVETSQSGVPIIGNDDTVVGNIKFQYIIYIGDELTEK